jgi:DNA/RNA endonuclease G (NUC1)
MKKFLLILLLTLVSVTGFSQSKVDTIIRNGVYESHFCLAVKQPLFVTYKMYKGGGDCSRAGFRFKNDTKIPMATLKDYAASGYDQGHLVSAEDFAFDCIADEKTFRFYNCLPQTPNLNRGIWKKWETEIRKESQINELYIIAGGHFTKKITIGNGVWVPTNCFKVVQDVKTKKIKHVLYFTNNNEATCTIMTLPQLEKILGYKLPILK